MGTLRETNENLNKGYHADTVWDDIILPPDRLGLGASAPDRVTLIGNIQCYGFDGGGTIEQLFGSFEIPHDYKEGTTLRPHVHCAPSSTDVGDIKWNIEFSLKNRNDVYDTVSTISAIVTTNGIDREHLIEEFETIVDPSLLIGATCEFRLYRDPTDIEDTYNADALLLSVGIHYEVDGDGSRNVMSKE